MSAIGGRRHESVSSICKAFKCARFPSSMEKRPDVARLHFHASLFDLLKDSVPAEALRPSVPNHLQHARSIGLWAPRRFSWSPSVRPGRGVDRQRIGQSVFASDPRFDLGFEPDYLFVARSDVRAKLRLITIHDGHPVIVYDCGRNDRLRDSLQESLCDAPLTMTHEWDVVCCVTVTHGSSQNKRNPKYTCL